MRIETIFLLALVTMAGSTAAPMYESEPINYSEAEWKDAVAEYFAEGADGWESRGRSGYLEDFLDSFDIPRESQVLVYSTTSLQAGRIRPENPRAIYFNKDIYVGWVPGGDFLEVTASSPTTGTNFYTISEEENEPALARETHRCLRCHGGSFTRDIPAPFVRSVFPDEGGNPIFKAGTALVDQATPFEERHGGWFASGPQLNHRANRIYAEIDRGADGGRLFDMDRISDKKYPHEGSDLVALLILEHQSELHRLLAQLSLQTQTALYRQRVLDEMLGRTEPLSDSTKSQIKSLSDKVLRYMFFEGEADLPRIAIEDSPYAQYFNGNGPKDSSGRSLYDLRLDGSLFVYPFSYMVYSDAFQTLPSEAMDYITTEIKSILAPTSEHADYRRLTRSDKAAIRQILEQTTKLLREES